MSFQQVLEKEFYQRRHRNQRYSLRAYAKDLGVDQSALSRMIAGTRPITRRTVRKLSSRLRLPAEEAAHWLEVAGFTAATPIDAPELQQLAFDRFVSVADWYHDAILELTRLKFFRPDLSWIAKALDLDRNTVQLAVQRLERIGSLKVHPSGRWEDRSSDNSLIPAEQSDAVLQTYQKQVLENSARAIDRVPWARRDHTSLTLAADSRRIAEAKALTKRFRRQLVKLFAEGGARPDSVYQVQIGIFPLTDFETKEQP